MVVLLRDQDSLQTKDEELWAACLTIYTPIVRQGPPNRQAQPV